MIVFLIILKDSLYISDYVMSAFNIYIVSSIHTNTNIPKMWKCVIPILFKHIKRNLNFKSRIINSKSHLVRISLVCNRMLGDEIQAKTSSLVFVVGYDPHGELKFPGI